MNKLKAGFSFRILALAAAGALVLSVQAEEGASRGPAAFSEFDADGSGLISEEEFNTFREQRMAARAAEGGKMRGAATAPSFADIDTDGDGQLSQQELLTAQNAHREKMQAMGHGHGHAHCKDHEQGAGEGQGKGKGKGHCMGKGKGWGKGEGRGKGKGQDHMPVFSDFDLDGDGVMTESEFNEGHAARMSEMAAAGHKMRHAGKAPGFSGIDANGDGQVTKEEFKAHQVEHHGKKHLDESG